MFSIKHWRIYSVLSILALLITIPLSVAGKQTDEICFPETGNCISGRIREYWEQNGGLPVFGFPISAQHNGSVEGRSFQVQWFERARFELHPENAPPYDVLLGRLGDDRLTKLRRNWKEFPRSQPQENCHYFPETEHNVCGDILLTWQSNGLEFDGFDGKTDPESIALFGFPLSEAQNETVAGQTYVVQWFERARFELHPENAPPYHVLLGLLGTELHGFVPPPTPLPVTATPIPVSPSTSTPSPEASQEARYILYFYFAPEGCPNCRAMAPNVEQFYQEFGRKSSPGEQSDHSFAPIRIPLPQDNDTSTDVYGVPIYSWGSDVDGFRRLTNITFRIVGDPGLGTDTSSHPVTILQEVRSGNTYELTRGYVSYVTLRTQFLRVVNRIYTGPSSGST